MNRITARLATGLLIALLCDRADAYSVLGIRYPIGLTYKTCSGMSHSMAGTSAALPNDHNVGLRNPANLGLIAKTVFSSLATFDFTNISSEADGATANDMAFVPTTLAFGFPLGRIGTMGLSYEKRSGAKVRYQSTYPLEMQLQSVSGIDIDFARDGGMSVWQAGWGYSVGKWVQVGLSYERVYLTLKEARIKRIYGDFIHTSVDTSSIKFRGNGIRAGVIVPIDKLTMGLYGEYILESDAEYANALYDGTSSPSMDRKNFTLALPPSVSMGAAYAFSPEWLAGADVDMVLWDVYSSENLLVGAAKGTALSFSIGGQYIVAPNLLAPKYWEVMQYRTGFRYSQLPVETAREFAFTAGVGLPLSRGGGLLDIALEYGRRTDADYAGFTEEFLHFSFGFNGGRKWIKSTQSDY